MSWWTKFKEKNRRKDWENGYNFAAGALLRGEETPKGLQRYFYGDATDPFDYGIRDAIIKLKDIKLKKDWADGFDYATGILLRNEKPVEAFKQYFFDGAVEPFDYGVRDAIAKLKNIGFIVND